MSLLVTGLNHRTSSVTLRERLAFSARDLPKALLDLKQALQDAGVVILSTCNRVEIYAHTPHLTPPDELYAQIRAWLAAHFGLDEDAFSKALYCHQEDAAVRHLFKVASSLDSMVVGEAQILGQAHDAYLAAQQADSADKVLHALFQRAFTVAKSVRNETTIGEGEVSISSAAIGLASSIFMELDNKTVMIIGSGEMGELTLRGFVSRGVGRVIAVNRSPEKAQEIAGQHGGEALAFDALEGSLHRADIIVSTTAAPHFILHPDHIAAAMPRRDGRPIFVIDIAVPRDVDPAIADLENVYLYNMDDLEQVAEGNLQQRRLELDRGLALVDKGVEQFARWRVALAAEPSIVSITKELDAIRDRELSKSLERLPDLTAAQREEIEYLSKRIVNSILQSPVSQVKRELDHHDPHTVLHLFKRFFGLEKG